MNDKSLWGSVECPFELAPRWLTAPHEVSVDLVSASSPGTLSLVESYALTLRHTVKQFGTVKVSIFRSAVLSAIYGFGPGQL